MFRVRHKETGEIRTVYAVSGVLFLFYAHRTFAVSHWEWGAIEDYEPVED